MLQATKKSYFMSATPRIQNSIKLNRLSWIIEIEEVGSVFGISSKETVPEGKESKWELYSMQFKRKKRRLVWRVFPEKKLTFKKCIIGRVDPVCKWSLWCTSWQLYFQVTIQFLISVQSYSLFKRLKKFTFHYHSSHGFRTKNAQISPYN